MNEQRDETKVRVVLQISGLPDLVFEKELTDEQLERFSEKLTTAFVTAGEDVR